MRNDRGYTYLITNGREYKIGITTGTPVKRVAELQTGSPTKISISAYCYNSNALAMEQWLHTKFANKRLQGEWFALDDDDVTIIHHHFETNYLDEYFAPLSKNATEIRRKEKELKKQKKLEKKNIKQKKLEKLLIKLVTVQCKRKEVLGTECRDTFDKLLEEAKEEYNSYLLKEELVEHIESEEDALKQFIKADEYEKWILSIKEYSKDMKEKKYRAKLKEQK